MQEIASILCAPLVAIAPAGYASPKTQSGWVTLLDTSGGSGNSRRLHSTLGYMSPQQLECIGQLANVA